MSNSNYPEPMDLSTLRTYSLADRPSKVFADDLGKPIGAGATVSQWLDALPKQLAANSLRRVRDELVRARLEGRQVVAAIGGHVIKVGCAPYLNSWLNQGVLTAVAMNGAAAIHDFELAYRGRTSEDVGAVLLNGNFGMARETADAMALASSRGSVAGFGQALGEHLEKLDKAGQLANPEASLVLSAYRAGAACTIHVAIGTDVVHMHPQVSGSNLGEASMVDFRRLCTVVSKLAHGVWFNIGSAVIMPEVFLKAVSVARNMGHDLSGLVAINFDKESKYRTATNVLSRPAAVGLEMTGHHEILLPLLHAAVAEGLASARRNDGTDAPLAQRQAA
jgi:hypothetical protein